MKTFKLILGISGTIIAAVLLLTSTISGIFCTLIDSEELLNNSKELFLIFTIFLISSVAAICTFKSIISTFVPPLLYVLTGIIATTNKNTKIFAITMFIVAVIYFLSGFAEIMTKVYKKYIKEDL